LLHICILQSPAALHAQLPLVTTRPFGSPHLDTTALHGCPNSHRILLQIFYE
jgi:hypothetical protein